MKKNVILLSVFLFFGCSQNTQHVQAPGCYAEYDYKGKTAIIPVRSFYYESTELKAILDNDGSVLYRYKSVPVEHSTIKNIYCGSSSQTTELRKLLK